MSEQDSVPAESESSSGGAMDELANAVAGKTPPLTPAERRNVRMPASPNRMANTGLGLGIGAVVCITLLFTDVGCFAAVGVIALTCAGAICSVLGLQQVRITRTGRGVALAGLIISLAIMGLVILLRVRI